MNVGLKLPEKYYPTVKKILNNLLPDLKISRLKETNYPDITVISEINIQDGIKVKSYIQKTNHVEEIIDKEILAARYQEADFKRRCKARIKLSIYRLLCDYLNQTPSPWGILIGVRPTKLGHYWLDKSFNYQQIDRLLAEVYGVIKEKRKLLLDIIKRERKYLPSKSQGEKQVSIYLGVPFCPTKCNYCSFASYPLSKHQKYLDDFLEALVYEIKIIGQFVKESGLQINTVYIGGGTPTVLSSEQLKKLLNDLKEYFINRNLKEFNVEAGRPDTITKDKLKVLRANGVTRISINPQTMNQNTLNKIGRHHTVKEVTKSYNQARNLGFENINMDLIVGLPGERIKEIEYTLGQIKKLKPDSLTVHTLAIKRAAEWKQNPSKVNFASMLEIKEMLKLAKEVTNKLDLKPYYMYRQKNILGNFENVGYAKSDKESIYNILMMEERETVIGLGGGAITKLVNSNNWSLERLVNPKDPNQYINEIKDRTDKKITKLTSLLR